MAMEDMKSGEPTSAQLIDRLVDGELGEEERRKVLLALEESADGWRDCALAFLENQELTRLVPTLSPADAAAVKCASTSPKDRSPWTKWLALAATAFFAFVLGLRSDGWLRDQNSATNYRPEVVESQAEPREAQLVSRPANVDSGLTIDDFLSRPSILPEKVLRELEQSGLTVQSHRGVVPGTRPDGRPILIPYEELELVPVKNITH